MKFTSIVLAIFIVVGAAFYSREEVLNRSVLSWTGLGLEIAAVALGFGASCAGMLWLYDWLTKQPD